MLNVIYLDNLEGYLSFETEKPATTEQLVQVMGHSVDKENTYLVGSDLLVTFSVQDPNTVKEVKKMSGVKLEPVEKT